MYNPYQMQPSYPYMQGPGASVFQQPPQQPQQQPGQIEGVRWVSSMDEVNGTTIGFGQSALLMFTGENAFAIKSVSASGVPTTKVFDFTERQDPPAVNPADYVTKEEFEDLRRKYEQLAGQHAADAVPVQYGDPQYHADDAVVPGNPAAGTGPVLQPSCANGMDAVPAQ